MKTSSKKKKPPMKRWKKILLRIDIVLVLLFAAGYVIYAGGRHEGPGSVSTTPVPSAQVAARLAEQQKAQQQFAANERRSKQILFGDLHVHTTFSSDAFVMSIPLMGGEGAHPPADACDFARYCSALDFFALTDHAESLTPRHWRETKESVRQCNAVAGSGPHPDVVAFTGWEWTQIGLTPETHYGHKNVIFAGQQEDELPARPIAAKGLSMAAMKGEGMSKSFLLSLAAVPIRDFSRRQRYLDFFTYVRELGNMEVCPTGVDSRKLPADCFEVAETPRDLFDKLDQWGFDTLVIPHGTTWGFYTPRGYTWDKQLSAKLDDPQKQRLFEVYSGHGNSEEYRTWRGAKIGPNGQPTCPQPTADYEPCCWRAGEIIRSRCGKLSSAECEKRVKQARARYLALGVAGFRTIPGATVADWRGCGQCRDCFEPAFSYRPGGAAQYVLAKGNFDDPKRPRHARLGFIASSDNHKGRPGTGYKDYERRKMTEATGPVAPKWNDLVYGDRTKPEAQALELKVSELVAFRAVHAERQASFFLTGGLVAVHSAGRGRQTIWQALKQREVYGTSGHRILLWFDLQNSPTSSIPMGGEIALGAQPRFVVRAVGSFRQKPGCPADIPLSAERLGSLCAGECYHPSDQRYLIKRIEVVRIRPQKSADEPVETLIQDKWRVLPCPADQAGCRVEFSDPDFVAGARDVVYYVRAIQEATPGINAGNLRCKNASCSELDPCYGDYRTALDDNCLTKTQERAWSSPIWVRFDPQAAAAAAVEPVDADAGGGSSADAGVNGPAPKEATP